jgi:rusticyanin
VKRRRIFVVVGIAVLAVAGLGAGMAVAVSAVSSSPGMMSSGATSGSSYSYYRSVMSSFGGSTMMGGSSNSMMSGTEYRWMMGGASAPGWMRGGSLPGFMMGTSTDEGEVMGKLFANAPGSRVSTARTGRLSHEITAGETLDATHNRISFSGTTAHLVVVAGASGSSNGVFRIAGLVNPTVSVQAGARVIIEVVNADPNMAHGFVVSTIGSASSSMPMLTARPGFSGSALWFLGDSTAMGMHDATFTFTATIAGTYQYLSPVPGDSRAGMVGAFMVAER